MDKVLELKSKDKTGKEKVNGRIEIKNQTATTADLYFYGDIVSTSYNPDDWWSSGSPEDRAPQDVADFLNELDGKTDVKVHINSGGGDVFAGVAIYNILKKNSAKKTAYVDGLAASSASLIPFACDTIIIPSSAQLMIHNPWTYAQGNANGLRNVADMLDQVAKSMINIYIENAKEGISEDDIKQMMDDEKWFTGQEASEIFNIQVDTTEPMVASISSEFFGKYKHTPKNLLENIKPKSSLEDKAIVKDPEIEALMARVNNTLKFEEDIINENE